MLSSPDDEEGQMIRLQFVNDSITAMEGISYLVCVATLDPLREAVVATIEAVGKILKLLLKCLGLVIMAGHCSGCVVDGPSAMAAT